jgi:hypothetical protein
VQNLSTPVRLIFEQGAHIQDVRLIHVMRTHADMPFEALHLDAAYRTLALSRMFLDTGSVKALTGQKGARKLAFFAPRGVFLGF